MNVAADVLLDNKSILFDIDDALAAIHRGWASIKARRRLDPNCEDVADIDQALTDAEQATAELLTRAHQAHRQADPDGTLEAFARAAAERNR